MTLYILIGFLSGAFTFHPTTEIKEVCVRNRLAKGPTLILKIEARSGSCDSGYGFSGTGCSYTRPAWKDVTKIKCEQYQPAKVWREAGEP